MPIKNIETKLKEADLQIKELQLLKDDASLRKDLADANINKLDVLIDLLESRQVLSSGFSDSLKFESSFTEEEQSIIKNKIFEIIKRL